MSKAYFDLGSGIAGDMALGALVDLGLPVSLVKKSIEKIGLRNFEIKVLRGRKNSKGVNLHVVDTSHHRNHSTSYADVDRMLTSSKLDVHAKEIARRIFEKLAIAEAKVHGVKVKDVHFHETGAVDSIVDIVGAAVGLSYFKFDEIISSPIPFTRGKVECAHGTLPVPAPATMELIKGFPLEHLKIKEEIVTPTGAAIIVSIADSFGECQLQRIDNVGYGFGDKVIKGIPNALRIIVGEGFKAVVIETNIDDMSPESFEHIMDRLFAVGAVDVSLAQIQMKKNRPAIKIEVVCPYDKKDSVMNVMLTETTSFGVRYWPVDRKILTRELITKKTKLGSVRYKIGYDDNGEMVKAIPEYADVKKIAKKIKKPIYEVQIQLSAEGKRLV